MRLFALIGLVAGLQTAHGNPAGEAERSSMLQVNMNKAASCDAAKEFCIDAMKSVQDCVDKYTHEGTTQEGVCKMALCGTKSVSNSNKIRSEEAPVMRAMCKRAARSRRWGPTGQTCPLPDAASGHVYEHFCNGLDKICDTWALNFVRRANLEDSNHDALCGNNFVKYSKNTFTESNGGPGCTNHEYAFPGYLTGLPSVTEYMAQSSTFTWTLLDDNTPECTNADKLYAKKQVQCDDPADDGCKKDTCLHRCERDSECGGVVYEPENMKKACQLKKTACLSREGYESLKLHRGAGLVQTSNASDSKISAEDESLLVELQRRSRKMGSSEDVIDQHLESAVLAKCAEPCD